MKKMMIMMALAMGFAISAQAASVTWTTSALLDHNGTAIAGGNMQFSASVVFYMWSGTIIDAGLPSESIGVGTWVLAPMSTGTSANKTNNVSKALVATAGPEFKEGVWYKGVLSVTGPASPEWFVNQELVFRTNDAGNTNISFAPLTWQQIPEPATMALLGIGIVAVGLRRRRK